MCRHTPTSAAAAARLTLVTNFEYVASGRDYAKEDLATTSSAAAATVIATTLTLTTLTSPRSPPPPSPPPPSPPPGALTSHLSPLTS